MVVKEHSLLFLVKKHVRSRKGRLPQARGEKEGWKRLVLNPMALAGFVGPQEGRYRQASKGTLLSS